MLEHYELVVVGAGPAGMAAALEAQKQGVSSVLLVDRNSFLGGILPQCIHDGFGLTEFRASLTGPEYATRYAEFLQREGIECLRDTTVVNIEKGKHHTVTLSGPVCGFAKITTDAVIIATGCRERTIGQMRIPGSRPAGVYTAGAVQYMMNRQNFLPGKSAVILGTGDVGLIMARRLTLEGVNVKLIVGKDPGCLLRNYITCVRDFEIPFKLGYTVISTHGHKRLKGVTVAPISPDGVIDESQKEYIPCDTVVVAAGLIPETELWSRVDEELNQFKGVPVDSQMASPVAGIFACGNVVQVYDTADLVSEMGRTAGRAAARYIKTRVHEQEGTFSLSTGGRKLTTEDMTDCSKRIVCTMCPLGCVMSVSAHGEGLEVTGNRCPRGITFAYDEWADPQRMLTSTVRIMGADCPLLPVRTAHEVSLDYFDMFVALCRKIDVTAPVHMGDVIRSATDDFPVDIIATATFTSSVCND